jgi:hypothetical protein
LAFDVIRAQTIPDKSAHKIEQICHIAADG